MKIANEEYKNKFDEIIKNKLIILLTKLKDQHGLMIK